METEIRSVWKIVRQLDERLLELLIMKYAPSVNVSCGSHLTKRECISRMAELATGFRDEFAALSSALIEIDNVARNLRYLARVIFIADQFGCLTEISATLDKKQFTAMNLVAWTRLRNAALWRRYYAEAFERDDSDQEFVGMEFPSRQYVYEAPDTVNITQMTSNEWNRRHRDFVQWMNEFLKNSLHVVNPGVWIDEAQTGTSYSFNIYYNGRPISDYSRIGNPRLPRTRGDIRGVKNNLLVEVDLTARQVIVSSNERGWFLQELVSSFACIVLDCRLYARPDRHYDLSRFLSRETAVLELPSGSGYRSAKVTDLMLGFSMSKSSGRVIRLHGTDVYDQFKAFPDLADGSCSPHVIRVGITLTVGSASGGLVNIRLSRTKREISCPPGCGWSRVNDLLRKWGLDGVDRGEIARLRLSRGHVRTLLDNLGYEKARLQQKGRTWVSNRVPMPDGRKRRLVIADTAESVRPADVKGVSDPLLLTVDNSVPQDGKLIKFINGISSMGEVCGYRIEYKENRIQLTAAPVQGKPEVSLKEAAIYCGYRSPETIRQWELHPKKAPAGYPGRQDRKRLQLWGENWRSSRNYRKAARKLAIPIGDASRIPENSIR